MKKISILVPCFNEEENVRPMCEALTAMAFGQLSGYDYEIIFIDNHSSDRTRRIIEELCAADKRVKAIFNCKNFGQFNSPYYGMLQATGDCVVLICADFQDPVDMIPRFVGQWEQGYKIVCGVKASSRESRPMRLMRTCYYKLIKRLSSTEQIEHFTGFGLYDRSFIEVLRQLDDPTPFLRGIVAEFGPSRKEIPYEQAKRRAGKTHNSFYTLYDAAMLSFTSYTKVGLRAATFSGLIIALISVVIGLVYFVLKLIYWDSFPMGMAPVLIGMFFLGAVQLFFIGFLGEYILNINTRVMKRPLVIEEKRINFE
ncbi:MAG: glycosyltransferase family 2 protein [Oscillospiraceae bacterium]|nr:glycosyltransferase family 2 protein [Oscillospiraceae bacterium]